MGDLISLSQSFISKVKIEKPTSRVLVSVKGGGRCLMEGLLLLLALLLVAASASAATCPSSGAPAHTPSGELLQDRSR